MRNPVQYLGAMALVVAMFTFTGCARPNSAAGVRSNFSPELHSTTRSFEQHRNMEARSHDMNTRALWDDGARLLLVDRPRRLSPHPVP